MKFAYFGIPRTGGTHTVYVSLRTGLARYGVEVFWVGLGPLAKQAAEDPMWRHERKHGVVLAGDTDDEKQQAIELVNYLESGSCDGVFVSVLAGRAATNAMRYISSKVRRIMIVHSITPGTYAAARSVRDYVHATVGVSPRIQSDLIRWHGFPSERTYAIPNGIDVTKFERTNRVTNLSEPLRILSLGRIANSDKGMNWLPQIMGAMADTEATLTIAGDGPDLDRLMRGCEFLGDRVHFAGRVSPDQVPNIIAAHDVFIMPSRFEGLGLALVEAMVTGCVPVASRIKGVTDFVVSSGENGLLFDVGDVGSAARMLSGLASNRDYLARLSLAARENATHRFTTVRMAEAYFEVISSVVREPSTIRRPLPFSSWSYPRGLRSGLRSKLPEGMKNWLRTWRERLL